MTLPDGYNTPIDNDGIKQAESFIRSRLFWVGFNVLLLLGGIAALFVELGGWGLIAFGIFIICPISIARNLHQYHKAKKDLSSYLSQFDRDEK